jgi:acyl-CoA reductase-like NAD-dependent aldehyde dehydrogenase
MENQNMFIGGKWVTAESGKTFAVLNPSTKEVLGHAPLGGAADIDKAVKAANQAFPVWSAMMPAERAKALQRIAEALRNNADALIALEINEHGTPKQMAINTIEQAATLIEYTASISRALMGQVIPAIPNALSFLQRVPLGVCACIVPWNGVYHMMVDLVAPALAAGNTCVIKPASINSLSSLKFAEVLDQAGLPAGAVNMVTGPGELIGKALASHPGVDIVRFTGSSETGKSIMSVASSTVKKLVMELGGKNPVIIYEDADVEKAAMSHALRHFINTAQNCSTPGVYFVHEKVYEKFIDIFVSEVKKIVVGDPWDDKTTMGPMANKQQMEKVESLIQSAIDEGARIIFGGKRPSTPPLNKGYFLTPTIIADVTHDMTIAREEIFGPAVCIQKFSSQDDIIATANDTPYGLCGVVWTRDIEKGMRAINQLRAGNVYLNMPRTATHELPWGGNVKESGLGKAGSMCGMEELTDLKQVCLNFG